MPKFTCVGDTFHRLVTIVFELVTFSIVNFLVLHRIKKQENIYLFELDHKLVF